MKKKPVVHCSFSKEGPTLSDLLKHSFQVYLRRILQQEKDGKK